MGEKRGKVIAFANQKGGVGKTTCCVNFAVQLSEKGYRVLLVDLDTQANATMYFGYENPDMLEYTIGHALNEVIECGSINTKNIRVLNHKRFPGLWILGANTKLFRVTAKLTEDIYTGQTALTEVLQPIKHAFDYILIDCAPSLDIDLVNALSAADEVIIVTNAGTYAAAGSEQLMKSVAKIQKRLNPDLEIAGILINNFDGRNRYSPEMEAMMRTKWGNVFETKIPRSIRVEESQCQRVPITTYDANNPVSAAFRNLVEEFLTKEVPGDSGKNKEE